MATNKRPEPAILRTRLVRGPDGRLQVETRGDATEQRRKPKRAIRSLRPLLTLVARSKPAARNIDANLKLSKLRLTKLPTFAKQRLGQLTRVLARLPKLAYPITGGALLIVVVGGVLVHNHLAATSGGSVQGAQTATGPTPGTPNYSTILPGGKNIQSLGGWYRVSPPSSDPVYAFADKIGSVQLDVSEQPLPTSFKDNTSEQVAQLAQSFGATQKLTTQGVTVYIGTSVQGPQSVILTKDDLLILIRSTDKLTNDQWIAYVSSLQ